MRALCVLALVCLGACAAPPNTESQFVRMVHPRSAQPPRVASPEELNDKGIPDCDPNGPANKCVLVVRVATLPNPYSHDPSSDDYYSCKVTEVEPKAIRVHGKSKLIWTFEKHTDLGFRFLQPTPTDEHGSIAIVGGTQSYFLPSTIDDAQKRRVVFRSATGNNGPATTFSYNVVVSYRPFRTSPSQLCEPLDPIIINVP